MSIALRATECDSLIQQFITCDVPYPEVEWVQQRHLALKVLPRHWREFWDVQAWGRRPQRTVHDRFLDTASDSIGRRQARQEASKKGEIRQLVQQFHSIN
eukprot:scaffold3597_cov202-Amphora_coffeaeformis.AAC.2